MDSSITSSELLLKLLRPLEGAFSREKPYARFTMLQLAMCLRRDHLGGVTSLVRALRLKNPRRCYEPFLHVFRSNAINHEALAKIWLETLLKECPHLIKVVNGRVVLELDGKVDTKEGTNIAGVQLLHQSSHNNSKASHVMGQYIQSSAILFEVTSQGVTKTIAIPIKVKIHLGTKGVSKEEDAKSLNKKAAEMMIAQIEILELNGKAAYVVADTYYNSKPLIKELKAKNADLITRVRRSGVAYELSPKYSGRGRRPIYGAKVSLYDVMKDKADYTEVKSPFLGDEESKIQLKSKTLKNRSAEGEVLYVFAKHPKLGNIIVMSTDVSIDPLEAYKLYAERFLIEISFRSLEHTVNGTSHRFHMRRKKNEKTRFGDGAQNLEGKDKAYIRRYFKNLRACELFMQMGVMAVGLLSILSLLASKEIMSRWEKMEGWYRTQRSKIFPSENMVQEVFGNTMMNFFEVTELPVTLKKLIKKEVNVKKFYRDFSLCDEWGDIN